MDSDDVDSLIVAICMFIIFPAIVIMAKIYESNNYKMYYTYVDLDNNDGIAYECEYTDKSYKSGGMGTPICKLEDGIIIAVKQYKFIKESKGE